MDAQTGTAITVIIITGGVIIIGGVRVYLRHKTPWALRNRRKPKPPRQRRR